jgi:hypothetical protein
MYTGSSKYKHSVLVGFQIIFAKLSIQGQLYNFEGPWTNKKIRTRWTFNIKIKVYSMNNKNYFAVYVWFIKYNNRYPTNAS